MDGVDPVEGKHLYNIIKENPQYLRSVEIGCACGTSALYLCQALVDGDRVSKGGFHVSVDPNQDTQYKSIARTNLKRAGLDGHFRLVHEPNYLALGLLLREVRTGQINGRFHLVFVDGWLVYSLLSSFAYDCYSCLNIIRTINLFIPSLALPSPSPGIHLTTHCLICSMPTCYAKWEE